MKKILNVENAWDGEVGCPEIMGSGCLISEKDVAAIGIAAGPTGVMSEMN